MDTGTSIVHDLHQADKHFAERGTLTLRAALCSVCSICTILHLKHAFACRLEASPEPASAPEPPAPAADSAPPQPAAPPTPEAQNAAAVNSLLQLVQQIQVADGDGHSLAARNALLKAAASLSLNEPERPASASGPSTPHAEHASEPAPQQAGAANLNPNGQQPQAFLHPPGLPGYPMHPGYAQSPGSFSPGQYPYMPYPQPGSAYQFMVGHPWSPVGYPGLQPPFPQGYPQGGSPFTMQSPGMPAQAMQYRPPQPGFISPTHMLSPQEQWGAPQYPPPSPASFSQAGSQGFSQPAQQYGSAPGLQSPAVHPGARNLQSSFSQASPAQQAETGMHRTSSAGARSAGARSVVQSRPEPAQQPSR